MEDMSSKGFIKRMIWYIRILRSPSLRHYWRYKGKELPIKRLIDKLDERDRVENYLEE